MGDERLTRELWHSINGGRTWERITVYQGSILYQVPADDFELEDAYGNRYRTTPPERT